jgi:uncharacterized protein (DUF433 family)
MQAVKLMPCDLDMQILKLAAESHFGVPGRAMKAILPVMLDRGAKHEDIYKAIEILEGRGWVTVTCHQSRASKNERLGYTDTTVEITTKGKEALRQMDANTQFNVRVPKLLAQELQDYAEQARTSMSAAAIEFMLEGVRMAKFPGIDFRWTPTGRFPHVTGTGLSVWEMFRIYRDHKEDVRKIRENYPPFTSEQIHTGVAYAKAYIHEMPVRPTKPAFAREVKVS